METRINRSYETSIKIGLKLFFLVTWLVLNTDAAAQTLSYVKIVAGSSGDGAEFGSATLTTDQTLTVHAAGYDSSGKYLSDQTVAWSVSGGIGALTPTTGTTTTLEARRPGTGIITADHATATDDVSGTITVVAGVPHRIKVLSGASGASAEVGVVAMVSSQTLVVHASRFDANENYIGDVTVNWSASGGIGILNPASGISTIFTAITVGSGVITADHTTLIDDATGTITVFAGPLSLIKIVEGTSGNAPELGDKSLTTDQTLTVHTAGYDANNNYLGDQSVTWSVSGGIGVLASTTGTTTTLNARTPGVGIISADHTTATDDVSGTITVTAGAAHHVKILAGPSGATPEVANVNLIVSQVIAVHASGFDADDNYIGDVIVSWSVSGGIGTLAPISGISTILTATTAGTGVITADHPSLLDDATGVITVSAGTLSFVEIVEGVAGNGPELGSKTLTTDQTLTVHAAGYDANGNYVGDQIVAWSVSGGIGTLTSATGTTTTLDATTPGSGALFADHATATDDVSDTITVVAGAPHHIKVLSGASGATAEVAAVLLTASQTLIVHAGGFDADDNYIGDVVVDWSLTGGIGTLTPASGITTTFVATTVGSGVIIADHPTLTDDATGIITVVSGTLNFVKIVEGVSGNGTELGNKSLTTDQTLTVHAAGYDASGNYLGDQTVTWAVSGGIGTLSTTVGSSTTFDAKAPGVGMMMADHPAVADDTSGVITVTLGAAHHVKILAGAAGNTPEVDTVAMRVGASLIVHASSFDADQNRIADAAANWSLSNGLGTLNPLTGIATTFTATGDGKTIIIANSAALINDSTGVITVGLGTAASTDPAPVGAPQSFRLLQNYPNPFRAGLSGPLAMTRINYELPQNSPVKITVHNLSGQLIRTLFDGQQNAGRYAATWNGAMAGGERVASGIYLFRMEAGRFTATRKMVVAR